MDDAGADILDRSAGVVRTGMKSNIGDADDDENGDDDDEEEDAE